MAVSRFKQGVPTLQLSMERGTSEVPSDGRYYVLLQGKILFSSVSQRKALQFYGQERNKLYELYGRPKSPAIDRKRWLQDQRVTSDIQAMRSEWLKAHGAKVKKGGKGGRGGI